MPQQILQILSFLWVPRGWPRPANTATWQRLRPSALQEVNARKEPHRITVQLPPKLLAALALSTATRDVVPRGSRELVDAGGPVTHHDDDLVEPLCQRQKFVFDENIRRWPPRQSEVLTNYLVEASEVALLEQFSKLLCFLREYAVVEQNPVGKGGCLSLVVPDAKLRE